MSNPGSMVGNIGVIIQSYDLTELAKKLGMDVNTFKTGPYKDLLSSWRKASKKEKAIIQSMIDNVHSQFIQTFMSSRKLTYKQAKRLADGRIHSGEQALEEGLVDQLGGLQDAINLAKETAGITGEVDLIQKEGGSLDQLFGFLQSQFSAFFQSQALSLIGQLR